MNDGTGLCFVAPNPPPPPLGAPFAPRPAAHSIFKTPREMDVHAGPPVAERMGGGAGAEGTVYSRAR